MYRPRVTTLLCTVVFALGAVVPGCGKNADDTPSQNAGQNTQEESLKTAAEAGDPVAQIKLARSLDGADGATANPVQAFAWYEKAARAGNAEAMYVLSERYTIGMGVSRNEKERKAWLSRAAEAGYAKAQYREAFDATGDGNGEGDVDGERTFVIDDGLLVGENQPSFRKNAQDIIYWLEKASAQNFELAKVDLGLIYLNGISLWMADNSRSFVLKPDLERAIPLLTEPAEQGNWKAQLALASLYQEGRESIAADRTSSAKWWEALSLQTAPGVQKAIGDKYVRWETPGYKNGSNKYRGRSLTFDETNKVAADWYEKAESQGDATAAYALSQMYGKGIGRNSNESRSTNYLKKAAEKGHGDAQFELGAAYLVGKGVPKDFSQAFHWFAKATNPGPAYHSSKSASAQSALGVLYENGWGVDSDSVAAYAWYNVAAAAGLEKANEHRASLEGKLTSEQLRNAQSMSRDWKPGLAMVRPDTPLSSTTAGQPAGETLKAVSMGTGFVISAAGDVLTNQHVVADCKEIRVPSESKVAKHIVADQSNDLALIRLQGEYKHVARMADADETRQGDEIVVFGFPLDGYLSSSGNITFGLISAQAGPGNNSSIIQITAPVQPGNSGGPVLDRKGRVVGVVTGKADAIRVAKMTGDIPQNINFAVEARTVKAFLDGNHIEYRKKKGLLAFSKNAADLADEARAYTLKLECWR